MKLARLAEILEQQFGPPFLQEEIVKATFRDDGSLWLRIGPRDVAFNEEGEILGSGTDLCTRLRFEKVEPSVAREKVANLP